MAMHKLSRFCHRFVIYSFSANNYVIVEETTLNMSAPLGEAPHFGVDAKQDEAPRFGVGAAVECHVEEGWVRGKVVAHDYRDDNLDETMPYQVQLLSGGLIYAPVDDNRVIRAAVSMTAEKLRADKATAAQLGSDSGDSSGSGDSAGGAGHNEIPRFSIGALVVCRVSTELGWMHGVVVDHDYREGDWEAGRCAPYQVRLNPEGKLNGHKVSVPRDADDIICAAFALGAAVECSGPHGWVHGEVVALDSAYDYSTYQVRLCPSDNLELYFELIHVPHPRLIRAAPAPKCASCGKQGVAKKCAKCKLKCYCSAACQKQHWKGGHKAECAAITDKVGQALAQCATNGDADGVTHLVKSGADTNWSTDSGGTPLMFAANGNHVGCAKLLLAAGADKDATDEDGDTALSIAASVGHKEVVQLLTTADVRW
jgi:hypothetical protein